MMVELMTFTILTTAVNLRNADDGGADRVLVVAIMADASCHH